MSNEINYRVGHAQQHLYSNLKVQLRMEGKTAQTILSFNVWNIDAMNITETTHTAPWHRLHVNFLSDKLRGPKFVTLVTEFRGHYLKYVDEILHPLHGTPPLTIYSDASTDPHGVAVIGVLILDIALKKSE